MSMKLTRAASYAFHALSYLGMKDRKHPVPSHIIAQAEGIPERFLLKVLKPLVSVRVLVSIKGPNGGYRLAKSLRDVTMLDVVEAVDGPIRSNAPLGLDEGNGRLNQKLDAICIQTAEQVRRHFEKIRLSDLLSAKR
jgi:Rrf2 family protein